MHPHDERWMRLALGQARQALERDEVPVGAVVVHQNQVLSQAHNLRESLRDPLAHAEMLALRRASRRRGDWRLDGATLYVTLEPCPMCAGALLAARLDRVVFAAPNFEQGAAGTVMNVADHPGFTRQVRIDSGVLAGECSQLLEEFFQRKRTRT